MKMGDVIKKLREEKGITQEQLGEVIGVQKSAIRKYEKGEVENIKRSSIQKMAEYFGVTPCYLMGWEETYNHNNKLSKEVALIEEIQNMYGKEEVELLSIFVELNEQGKTKALENISDISEIPRYQNSTT